MNPSSRFRSPSSATRPWSNSARSCSSIRACQNPASFPAIPTTPATSCRSAAPTTSRLPSATSGTRARSTHCRPFQFQDSPLRNVELTYPYFHDGPVNTFGKAVDTMGRIQLGKKFSRTENASIVAFLRTLTGDQADFKLPTSPPSSDSPPDRSPLPK